MQTIGIREYAFGISNAKHSKAHPARGKELDAHDKLLLGAAMLSDTSISSDEDISSASESARQDFCVDKPSTSSGSEHSDQFAERSLYCLALVNSETGDAVRAVTDEEAEEVARALAGVGNRSKAQGNATLASATPTGRQGSVARPKPGGPCDNCGVLDSPQWRRGPADAPVLCNACGTRFRRTSQLASGGLRALKRAAEAQKQQQHVKHPKVNTLVACIV